MKPELLMPAGNLEKLEVAYRYGADACYIGAPNFSLRYRENQTSETDLAEAVKIARKLNKKIYVTVNTYPHNQKIDLISKHIKYLAEIKPDAIIFSDTGVFNLIKKYYPDAEMHLSVQATTVNYESVRFWQKLGVKRIILARELSFEEIKEIREKVPGMQIECFVHGAICMAYSGRCLLSNYLAGRDANQGDCAHVCRWNFKTYLEENLRPGQYMPIYENDHGSHILSSRDLCLIEHIKEFTKIGVSSLKIEGRAKNVNYVATIAKSYRKAIDDAVNNKKFDKNLLSEVSSVSNRGFFTGFYFGKPTIKDQQLNANRTEGTYEYIGIVRSYDPKNNLAEIEVKGQVKEGDDLEILSPDNLIKFKINKMFNHLKMPISIYHPGLKYNIYLEINHKISKYDIIRKKIQ